MNDNIGINLGIRRVIKHQEICLAHAEKYDHTEEAEKHRREIKELELSLRCHHHFVVEHYTAEVLTPFGGIVEYRSHRKCDRCGFVTP